MPSQSETRVASESAAAAGSTAPIPTVMAESPCQPSTIAPKSSDTRSPSRNTSSSDGMPWTTRSFTDAQMTAG